MPLNDIGGDISEFRVDRDSYIHCAGGYRSIIANSILKSRGIHNLIDVKGGFSSIKRTDIPTRKNTCSN